MLRSTRFLALVLTAAVAALAPAAHAAKKKTPTPAAEAASDSKSSKKKSDTTKTEPAAAPVDINTASASELAEVKGIGPKIAKEIVKGRPYRTVDELDHVKGISAKKLAAIRPYVTVGGGTATAGTTSGRGQGVPEGAPTPGSPAGKATGGRSSAVSEGAPTPGSPGRSTGGRSQGELAPGSGATMKLQPGQKVNINTAPREELEALPEIGPVKAQAIIDYRNANGRFQTPEDIEKVKGIKEGTYSKIKDWIVVR